MGLRLFFLQNFPAATFIEGATFIPDSRVGAIALSEGSLADINPFCSLKWQLKEEN